MVDGTTIGDVARATFASIWGDGLGTSQGLSVDQASMKASGAGRGLRLQYASLIATHFRQHGRHGQYRWIYQLFTDPDKRAADLLTGIRHHLTVHETYRVNLLTQIHRPIVDGTTLLGELNTALGDLRTNWEALRRLFISSPEIADQQLNAFRRLLNVRPVDDLSRTIAARSLGPDEIRKLGNNVFARLYGSWLHLATLCRTQEVVALAATQTPGVECGRLFFDTAFRATLLERLSPIALGVAFLVGGFSLIRAAQNKA
ncbi:MAG: hypothetical protein HYY44_02165 [Deltaproteobacteria bacterium]|nr:hypothetical protein [Deltaproteobacteria bacterium]